VLNTDTVRHVAKLARIKVDEAALPGLAGELSVIMGFVEQLAAVNTDGIEPLRSTIVHPLRLREDKVTDGGQQDAVLKNAPEKAHGFFVVPKVVE
jgi:aspartyl-tRNA(Asn)/glutamyl-tRNA(Gln) amidotransferase subunit C